MNRPALRFALTFLVVLGLFALLFQLPIVNDLVVRPLMVASAHASSPILNLMGMETQVSGTTISGPGGSSVDISVGCDGSYVTAILVAAVLAFPSTWKEKLSGLALGVPAVQVVNLVRILSLYWIQANRPDLFDQFHYYVWQTGVIIVSMAIWIFWAEVLVGKQRPPARPAAG